MGTSWAAVEVEDVAHVVHRRGPDLVVEAMAWEAMAGRDRGSTVLVLADPPVVAGRSDRPVVVEQRDGVVQVHDLTMRHGRPRAVRRGAAVGLASGEELIAATTEGPAVDLVLRRGQETVLTRLAGGRLRPRSVVAPWPAVAAAFHQGRLLLVGDDGPDPATAAALEEVDLAPDGVTRIAVARSGARTYLAVTRATPVGARYELRETPSGRSASHALRSVPHHIAVVPVGGRVDVIAQGTGIEVHDALAEGDESEVVVDLGAGENPVVALNGVGGWFDRMVLLYPPDGHRLEIPLPEYQVPRSTDLLARVSQTPLGLVERSSVVRRIASAAPPGWADGSDRAGAIVVGVINLLDTPQDIEAVRESLVKVEGTAQRAGLETVRVDGPEVAMAGEQDGWRHRLDVVHLVGHCRWDPSGPILSSRQGDGGLELTPDDLVRRLHQARTQLVVLRACASAEDTARGWSFAARLHLAGIPIVVGFADPISAVHSGDYHTTLNAELVKCLQEGRSIERALTRARAHATKVAAGPYDDIDDLLRVARRQPDVGRAVDFLAAHLRSFWLRPVTYMHGPDAQGRGGDGVIAR